MNPSVDLNEVSIEDFYNYLETRKMFPSHKILEKNNKKYLKFFQKLGYHSMANLFSAISNKKKCEIFSEKHNLDFEYITILRRHIGGFIVKPRLLSEFSLLDISMIELLNKEGIRNTKDLNDKFNEITIPKKYSEYLHSIIGKFTDGLYLCGYKSINIIAKADPLIMNAKLNEAMKTHNIANVNLGISDSQFLINDAKLYLKWFKEKKL